MTTCIHKIPVKVTVLGRDLDEWVAPITGLLLDWFVRYQELAEIMANNFMLDLTLIESIAIVHSKNACNHLIYYDHIKRMGFHKF